MSILKEVNKYAFECCGRTPLIEVETNKTYSLWEFCPECLECSAIINKDVKHNKRTPRLGDVIDMAGFKKSINKKIKKGAKW